MKRMMGYLLALVLLLTVMAPAAFATEVEATEEAAPAATESEENEAEVDNACGDDMTWSYSGGVLTITGSGNMHDFTDGAAPWQEFQYEIQEVVLSGEISYIGSYAFKDFDALLAVDFGSALYEIGTEAFASCDGLTSIWMPASFKVFGEGSFQNCTALEEIHCEGRFPSFRQNCLWATFATIFYPASAPWNVENIAQLEEAFQGRIEFLAEDGTDHYIPEEEEVTEETTEATEEEVTEETTEATEEVTEDTEPVEESTEEAAPETSEETQPQATEGTQPVTEQKPAGENKSSGKGLVVLIAVVAVLAMSGALGAALFMKKGDRGGRYKNR